MSNESTMSPQQQPAIFKAVLSIMSEVGAVEKAGTNKDYKYRKVDDVYAALQLLLAKHGVFTTSEILADHSEEKTTRSGSAMVTRRIKIRYHFHAADGSSVFSDVIGEGFDSGDKASNKAMAVAHKYALCQIFCIPTDDPKDPEQDNHDVRPGSGKNSGRTGGASGAAQKGVPSGVCAITKDTVFDDSTAHHEKAVEWLRSKNVDQNYWSSIATRMKGQPFSQLGVITKQVMEASGQ